MGNQKGTITPTWEGPPSNQSVGHGQNRPCLMAQEGAGEEHLTDDDCVEPGFSHDMAERSAGTEPHELSENAMPVESGVITATGTPMDAPQAEPGSPKATDARAIASDEETHDKDQKDSKNERGTLKNLESSHCVCEV